LINNETEVVDSFGSKSIISLAFKFAFGICPEKLGSPLVAPGM
jgi:hypothetical protein